MKKTSIAFTAVALAVVLAGGMSADAHQPSGAESASLTDEQRADLQKTLDDKIIPALKSPDSHSRLTAVEDLFVIGYELQGFENVALGGLIGALTDSDENVAFSALERIWMVTSKTASTARYSLPLLSKQMASSAATANLRTDIVAIASKLAQRFPVLIDDVRFVLGNAEKSEKDPQVQQAIKRQLAFLKDFAQQEHPTVPEQLKPLP